MRDLILPGTFIAPTSYISLHLLTPIITLLQESVIKITCKLVNKAVSTD